MTTRYSLPDGDRKWSRTRIIFSILPTLLKSFGWLIQVRGADPPDDGDFLRRFALWYNCHTGFQNCFTSTACLIGRPVFIYSPNPNRSLAYSRRSSSRAGLVSLVAASSFR